MSKDYYKILGVDKKASQEEVKKAFYKLAHQHHPDKAGGNEAKFKEINEAYQTLSDSKKRAQYDQFGSGYEQAGGFGRGAGAGGFDFNGQGFNVNMDDLGEMFGGFGDIFGFSGGSRARKGGPKRGADIEVNLNIEFKEAVFGIEKEIKIQKYLSCNNCHGSGMAPGAKIETCKTCGGRGKTVKIQRTIFGQMQVEVPCDTCGGEGKSYSEKCSHCSGTGITKDISMTKVHIPAGIDEGNTIRFTGLGNAGQNKGPAGDLYLTVRINKDKHFTRNGNDILSKVSINFTTAALGGNIKVETVDGPEDLKIPEGTQSSTIFRLKSKGVTKINSHSRGDHLVEITVQIPTHLSRKQKDIIKELNI